MYLSFIYVTFDFLAEEFAYWAFLGELPGKSPQKGASIVYLSLDPWCVHIHQEGDSGWVWE